MIKRKFGLFALACGAAALITGQSHAQAPGYPPYPHKTVTLITSSGPGGGGDIFLRQLTKVLGPKWGINFVVESVAGSGGVKAMQRIQDSPADGTILYGVSTQHILVSILSKTPVSYTDMLPVVNVIYDAPVLYVPTNSPHKTLKDLLAWIKANPGKFKWGVGSAASGDRMTAEVIKKTQGLDFIIATHDSGGTQLVAVLGGSVELGTGDAQEVQPHVQSGKLRILAALTDQRLANYPDVATAKEQGVQTNETRFRGLVGHKKLPPDIIAAWEKAIALVVKDPDYAAVIKTNDMIAAPLPSKEFDRVTNELADRTRKVFTELGIIK
jgi:tripartite-type tricarboxylate transporter receptor subunit TctC